MTLQMKLAFIGLCSIGIGVPLWWTGNFAYGFLLTCIGLMLGILSPMWDTSKAFTDIIDRHTGAYNRSPASPQKGATRKW